LASTCRTELLRYRVKSGMLRFRLILPSNFCETFIASVGPSSRGNNQILTRDCVLEQLSLLVDLLGHFRGALKVRLIEKEDGLAFLRSFYLGYGANAAPCAVRLSRARYDRAYRGVLVAKDESSTRDPVAAMESNFTRLCASAKGLNPPHLRTRLVDLRASWSPPAADSESTLV